MKKFLFPMMLLLSVLLIACNNNSYQISGNAEGIADSTLVYLIDNETDLTIDSTFVINGQFAFNGKTDSSYIALMMSAENNMPIIIEPGCNVEVDYVASKFIKANKLNQDFDAYLNITTQLRKEYQAINDSLVAMIENQTITEEAATAIFGEKAQEIDAFFVEELETLLARHNNDLLGIILLSSYISTGAEGEQLDAIIATLGEVVLSDPQIASYIASLEREKMTAVGSKFSDFTIEYEDGTKVSLSDYVGKGNYVLVDFWASWCGPCRRSMPELIKLYNEFHPQGLDILGVAVWDRPEDTQKAIEEEQMPWPQIINAQKIPTDTYGITGIPHLILFAPDGTILLRGLPTEDFMNQVKELVVK